MPKSKEELEAKIRKLYPGRESLIKNLEKGERDNLLLVTRRTTPATVPVWKLQECTTMAEVNQLAQDELDRIELYEELKEYFQNLYNN